MDGTYTPIGFGQAMSEQGLGMDQLVLFYNIGRQVSLAPASALRGAVRSRASCACLVGGRIVVTGYGWVIFDLRRVVAIVVAKEVVASTVGDVVDPLVQV